MILALLPNAAALIQPCLLFLRIVKSVLPPAPDTCQRIFFILVFQEVIYGDQSGRPLHFDFQGANRDLPHIFMFTTGAIPAGKSAYDWIIWLKPPQVCFPWLKVTGQGAPGATGLLPGRMRWWTRTSFYDPSLRIKAPVGQMSTQAMQSAQGRSVSPVRPAEVMTVLKPRPVALSRGLPFLSRQA